MIYRGLITFVFAVILVMNCVPTFGQMNEDTLKVMKYMLDLSKDCFKGEITEEFVIKSMQDRTPNQDVKCFIGCAMKKVGMINDDGSFSREGTVEFLKKLPGVHDDKRDQLTTAVIDKCSKLESEDECEKGYLIHICGWAEYKALHG